MGRGESRDGKEFAVLQIKDLATAPVFAEEITRARIALVELLSEYNDGMVEKFIEHDEDHLVIPANDILASLRKSTTPQRLCRYSLVQAFETLGFSLFSMLLFSCCLLQQRLQFQRSAWEK